MKPLNKLLLIVLSMIPVACEYNTDSQQLPYKERLVIDGRLEAYSGILYVLVSRTLPLDETNSIEVGRITDANVFLSYEHKVAQLYYQNNRYDNDTVTVLPGKTYTLTVEWNGKRAWASTVVPHPALVDTVIVVRQSTTQGLAYEAEAIVTPRDREAYIPWWTALVPGGGQTFVRGTLSTRQDAGGDGRIHFSHLLRWNSPFVLDSLTIDCESYDWPYYEYYVSGGDPNFSGVPTYSYFEGPVRWNVEGDGVGLFVAYTDNYVTVGVPQMSGDVSPKLAGQR